MSSYFIRRTGGRESGPISATVLEDLVNAGIILRSDEVRRAEDATWRPLTEYTRVKFIDLHSARSAAFPAGETTSALRSERAGTVEQRTATVVATRSSEEGARYAWRRFWARIMDSVLVAWLLVAAITVMVLAFPAFKLPWQQSDLHPIINLVLAGFILCFVEALSYQWLGGTLGKLWLGILVIDEDTKPIQFRQAWTRSFYNWMFGYAFSIPVLDLGTLILAGFRISRGRRMEWEVKSRTYLVVQRLPLWRSLSFAGVLIPSVFVLAFAYAAFPNRISGKTVYRNDEGTRNVDETSRRAAENDSDDLDPFRRAAEEERWEQETIEKLRNKRLSQ